MQTKRWLKPMKAEDYPEQLFEIVQAFLIISVMHAYMKKASTNEKTTATSKFAVKVHR